MLHLLQHSSVTEQNRTFSQAEQPPSRLRDANKSIYDPHFHCSWSPARNILPVVTVLHPRDLNSTASLSASAPLFSTGDLLALQAAEERAHHPPGERRPKPQPHPFRNPNSRQDHLGLSLCIDRPPATDRPTRTHLRSEFSMEALTGQRWHTAKASSRPPPRAASSCILC